MRHLDEVSIDIRAGITRLIVPIQRGERVDDEAYCALLDYCRELSSILRGHELVPRGILYEIFSALIILRNESYAPTDNASRLTEMSGGIECAFHDLLLDQSPEVRQPGVPRIV